MYDLNEYMALKLLCTAQQQMPHYSGIPRGLVAVLLYYDGRKALVCSLRDLFQARSGISWCTDAHAEITQYISSYTSSLVENANILNKIIDLLDELDISKEVTHSIFKLKRNAASIGDHKIAKVNTILGGENSIRLSFYSSDSKPNY